VAGRQGLRPRKRPRLFTAASLQVGCHRAHLRSLPALLLPALLVFIFHYLCCLLRDLCRDEGTPNTNHLGA
jgi:hypothetical protein